MYNKLKILSFFCIFFAIFSIECTVKKIDKVAVFIDSESDLNSILQIYENEFIHVDVYCISKNVIKNHKDIIDNNSFTLNQVSLYEKQDIPIKTTTQSPMVSFVDGRYNIDFSSDERFYANRLIWALPIDSLKKNNLVGIEYNSFINSMKYFYKNHADDKGQFLKNVYYLGEFYEKGNLQRNEISEINTHLINHLNEIKK